MNITHDFHVHTVISSCGKESATVENYMRIAKEKGCGRMEWTCLDWNQPSIDFYLSLGAVPMSDWTVYRLTREGILSLAESDEK